MSTSQRASLGIAFRRIVFPAVVAFLAISETAHCGEDWRPNFPRRELFEEGRFVYEQNCVVCHGQFGDGNGELAAGLGIKPRSFRSGVFKYRTTPIGKMPTNEDLKRTVRDGVTGTAMGMFTNLRQEELEAVVEYIKGFSRKWRDEANFAPPVKFPKTPAWFADPAFRAKQEDAGAMLFKTHCEACHGASGRGDGPAAVALKDDLGNAAHPANLSDAHYRNGDEPQDVFRVLTLGVSGTPMVSREKELTVDERWQLAAFVRTLSAAGSK